VKLNPNIFKIKFVKLGCDFQICWPTATVTART